MTIIPVIAPKRVKGAWLFNSLNIWLDISSYAQFRSAQVSPTLRNGFMI
jgi:hypothetical protein